jgi:hypothetical protein
LKSVSIYKAYQSLSKNSQRHESLQTFSNKVHLHLDEHLRSIIDKIESDKYEEFIARFSNLRSLIELDVDESVLWSSILPLQESKLYAKNRLNEGKLSWLVPYLSTLTLLCKVYQKLEKPSPELELELSNIADYIVFELFKTVVLFYTQRELEIPWRKLQSILSRDFETVDVLVCEMQKILKVEEDSEIYPPSLTRLQSELWKKSKGALFIDDSFVISMKGTVVTGRVAKGVFHVDDLVLLVLQNGKILSSSITGLEFNRTLVDFVDFDMNVGALLKNVKEKDVPEGTILVTF